MIYMDMKGGGGMIWYDNIIHKTDRGGERDVISMKDIDQWINRWLIGYMWMW